MALEPRGRHFFLLKSGSVGSDPLLPHILFLSFLQVSPSFSPLPFCLLMCTLPEVLGSSLPLEIRVHSKVLIIYYTSSYLLHTQDSR